MAFPSVVAETASLAETALYDEDGFPVVPGNTTDFFDKAFTKQDVLTEPLPVDIQPAAGDSQKRRSQACSLGIEDVRQEVQPDVLKSVEALLFKDGGVSGNEVKTQLCLAAQDLANLMKLEKELKALARIA